MLQSTPPDVCRVWLHDWISDVVSEDVIVVVLLRPGTRVVEPHAIVQTIC